ncbi:hypothetical protein GCM10027612_17450 [Microbispora bryophytorum subsp. camponoti]
MRSRAPARTRARRTRLPSARRSTVSSTASAIPNSCIGVTSFLCGFHLVRREVEEPSLLTLELGAGIVLRGHGQVAHPVHVEEHRLDSGGPPGQEHVVRVRTAVAGP